MKDKNTAFRQVAFNIIGSNLSPFFRELGKRRPSGVIVGTCLDYFHYCCFLRWHLTEEIKEEMYPPCHAWSAKHLVSQS